MGSILITGATGNIGQAAIRFLSAANMSDRIIAGVRDIGKAKRVFPDHPRLEYVEFDFESRETFKPALKDIERVFLLRPPHIADVDRYFRPLISQFRESQVKKILFLSVQGVEASRMIPHNRIEKLIVESGLDYFFLRPGYFMQNLTTVLLNDIRDRQEVFLPAGKAKFNWVDVENIGEAVARLLEKFDDHKNSAAELTGYENENFASVIERMNRVLGGNIRYIDANPFHYYVRKRRDGIPRGLIAVMVMLHFLPRFRKEPRISRFYETLTGKKPTALKEFLEREKAKLES
jgi:uncharacterized protein YbjT (DUF2867 family)